ncbi:MAG: 5'-methylthioadenosine phosphorylase [Betaproteobacteria bacterium RIFCSPLOWO2_02_FULL_63_19]|nr:MAG: 5'-methylthioadenosine phosphorylase [Betaproteobacteria bacterium RIFCSPLOWO2_02_FULL_63_19]
MLAIIGGSGLSGLPGLDVTRREAVHTPYGAPSGPLTLGNFFGRSVMFLARHGDGHRIAPHEVNYRANLWAMRERKATTIVSVASVGGISSDLKPGTIVVPNQIIDYTWGRKSTYFEGDAPVTHVDFTEPYTPELRAQLLAAAADCGETVRARAVYATTQGPRLETAAEVDRLERDGADVVGMTGMPEAVLARELGLAYAAIAIVVNFAAGRGDSRDGIKVERIDDVLHHSMTRVLHIIQTLVASS